MCSPSGRPSSVAAGRDSFVDAFTADRLPTDKVRSTTKAQGLPVF
jgi:hypothetical protein